MFRVQRSGFSVLGFRHWSFFLALVSNPWYLIRGTLYLTILLNLLPFDDQKPVSIEFEIAVVVAIMIKVALFILVGMGVKLKIKSLPHQSLPGGFSQNFPRWNQRLENFSIFLKGMIDISDQVDTFRILLIVVGISATVITEFFINPTLNRFATVKAVSFFLSHSQKVSFNLEN